MTDMNHPGETIDRNGFALYARISIVGDDAPWLVFSNSLMTDHTVWDRQVERFGGRYNILRYDQRGHGLSGVPAQVSFDDLSGDVAALFDHYGIARGVYIGLSMGVPTGLDFAGRHADRLKAMVLVDGQMATQPSGRQAWQDRIDFARQNGMAVVADDTVQRWFSSDFVASGGAEQLRETAYRMQVDGYCACAAALQAYDFTQNAASLSLPVLLLAGANDGAMPQTMQAIAGTIPGSRFEMVAGAGHIPNLEQPTAFNQALDQFLTSLS